MFAHHDAPHITAIGTYIPSNRIPNEDKVATFGLEPDFLRKKLGFFSHAEKAADEDTSDLCVKAFHDLTTRTNIHTNNVQRCCVVTQIPTETSRIPPRSCTKSLVCPDNA